MPGCIVVADDDPTIVNLVSLRLGMAQYEVVAAHDAIAVLAIVRARRPDLVILDVQMPGGGGLCALSQIKTDPETSGVPVMMMTGARNAETVLQAMESGADDYLVKPFNPDLLLQRVSRLAGQNNKSVLI
jgi:two-component system phosphate regulon response regulator PhoB